MVSGPSIDSDIGAGAGAGRRTQSGTGLNNNNMTNYFVYHQAVQQWPDDRERRRLLETFIRKVRNGNKKPFYKLGVGP